MVGRQIIKLSAVTSAAGLNKVAAALLSGQIVLLPTDTIYGLSCLATNETAIRRILEMKGRPDNKPLISLVNSWAMVERQAIVENKVRNYLSSVWPGPVTAILVSRQHLPAAVTGGLSTIALRWPKNDWLNQLLAMVDQPLVSTSANLAGQTPITSIDEIDQYFINDQPDLIINAGVLKNPPSRIIDCQDPLNIKIIR
ncbi:threonylcarbamoyl-AMP synthase [Candidatus Falkowbacteria bacterium]|nr:threonylcarbamoyl-AMP synthase [Candidatus Falkowbacteria bacterium]